MATILFVWFFSVSVWHAAQETRGALWEYFARVYRVPFLDRIGLDGGLVFIVLPALTLQGLAAWFAFFHHSPVALGALIGLRFGDAVFSHVLPAVAGYGESPGEGTALLYLVDASVLAIAKFQTLYTFPCEVFAGALSGGGFFFLVGHVLAFLGRGK